MFCVECVTRKASSDSDLCLFCAISAPRPLPLCPSCKQHPQTEPGGLCFRCDDNVLDLSEMDEEEAILIASEKISKGQRVHLPNSKSAGSFISALSKMNEPGETYDLGLVTVPGTNIFCPDHQFIDRDGMPQISGMLEAGAHLDLDEEQRARLEPEMDKEGNPKTHADGSPVFFMNFSPEFVEYLTALGFRSEEGYAFSGWLRSTQRNLDGTTVSRLAQAIENGEKIEGLDKPIFVSKEGYVIDGHHRWAAFLAADSLDGDIDGKISGEVSPVLVRIIDIEISEALELAREFSRAMRIIPDAFFQSDQ